MKTYYEIALNEYEYLQSSLNEGLKFYNPMSIACQQIAEKMLKHILTISYNGSEIETLLKTHNLKKIYFAINGTLSSFHLDYTKLADLTDYFYDAKYPGDDYMDVSEEMFNGCYSTMMEVKNTVELFIK